jgi:Ca2+-binding RTX toxin-like protein
MLNRKHFYLTTALICSICSFAKAEVFGPNPQDPNELISSNSNEIIRQAIESAAQSSARDTAAQIPLARLKDNSPQNQLTNTNTSLIKTDEDGYLKEEGGPTLSKRGEDLSSALPDINGRYCTEGDDNCKGTDSEDSIYGGSGNDSIYGLGSNDKIFGQAGNDALYGNDGDDELRGDYGLDFLYGGQGNDKLLGEGQNDTLYGDKGDDNLSGGDGWDTLYGGEGNDTLYGDQGDDTLYGGKGDDTLYGGEGDDTLYGDEGNNTIVDFKGKNKAVIFAKNNSKTEISMNRESTLEIPDISTEDVLFFRNNQGSLFIVTTDGKILTEIKKYYFDETRSGALAQIKFSNVTLDRWMVDEKLQNDFKKLPGNPLGRCKSIWQKYDCEENMPEYFTRMKEKSGS